MTVHAKNRMSRLRVIYGGKVVDYETERGIYWGIICKYAESFLQ